MIIKFKFITFVLITVWGQIRAKEDLYSATYVDPEHVGHLGSKHTIHTLKGRYNEEARIFKKCESSVDDTEKLANQNFNKSRDQDDTEEIKTINVETGDAPSGDVTDTELNILSELFKNIANESRRLGDREDTSATDIKEQIKTSTPVPVTQTMVDSTQKHFEFESLIIKNEAENPTRKMFHLEERNDNEANEEHHEILNTRRFNTGEDNNLNTKLEAVQQSTPDFIESDDNAKLEVSTEENNADKQNSTENDSVSERNKEDDRAALEKHTSDISSEYKEKISKRHGEINVDSDITDLLSNDDTFSSEDVSRRANPTKGFGISDMVRSNLMLINHPRVCYACSSTNNPSCWSPDRRTPTKYCRRDHDACITKTFKHKGYAFIIRDCGNTCQRRNLLDLGIMYNSCTICHSDLCNGAFANSLNVIIISIVSVWYLLQKQLN